MAGLGSDYEEQGSNWTKALGQMRPETPPAKACQSPAKGPRARSPLGTGCEQGGRPCNTPFPTPA